VIDALILVVGVVATLAAVAWLDRRERARQDRPVRACCAWCGVSFPYGRNGRYSTCSPACRRRWDYEPHAEDHPGYQAYEGTDR
jgi:hypothetical protein